MAYIQGMYNSHRGPLSSRSIATWTTIITTEIFQITVRTKLVVVFCTANNKTMKIIQWMREYCRPLLLHHHIVIELLVKSVIARRKPILIEMHEWWDRCVSSSTLFISQACRYISESQHTRMIHTIRRTNRYEQTIGYESDPAPPWLVLTF